MTNTLRFNVVQKQCVSYVHKEKRGIVLLIWEYRDMHYILERANTHLYIMYAVSFGSVAPEPQRGCQFLSSKRTSFSQEFENLKALIPVCYNR